MVENKQMSAYTLGEILRKLKEPVLIYNRYFLPVSILQMVLKNFQHWIGFGFYFAGVQMKFFLMCGHRKQESGHNFNFKPTNMWVLQISDLKFQDCLLHAHFV